MPFNADTYRANQNARQAWARMAEARALRDRIRSGEAYEWEADRLPLILQYAKSDMKLAVFYRRQSAARK